jgi:prepilin-type N-terminal cleavage/methylation domain-containing protein/prepilin-type processing-associated H-X9-DG protein
MTMIVRPARKGLTLVETLVVIGIIAIVVAFTIPAVMSAREAARRTQCLNNLKQLLLATNLHLEQKNYYPREENGYSAFVLMLPFLEQPALFNAFNLTTSRDDFSGPNDVNYTAYSTDVSTFVCPSEFAPDTAFGRSSYGGNLGTGVGKYLRPDNGPFASSSLDPKIRDSLIRDGLANTVAISEFCQTNGPKTPRTGRAVFQLGAYGAGQFDAMIADCQNVDVNSQAMSRIIRGFCWAFAGLDDTLYDHNIPPNGHACACHGGATAGAWTASSHHNGGVNCAHLDGHVSYVRDGIAIAAWRALGTMAGGEIVSDQSP